MIRNVKKTDPEKLMQLKSRIEDKEYLDTAIKGIASALTNEFVNMNEDKSGIKFQ